MVAVKKERFDYQDYQRESIDSGHKKQRVKKPLSPVFTTGLLVLALVIMGISIIYRYSLIHTHNSNLQEVQSSYNQLVDKQNHLIIEVAQLQSLTRIDKIASEQLGLRPPNPDQIVVVNKSNWGGDGN